MCVSENGDVYESTNNNNGGCKLLYKFNEVYEMLLYSVEKRTGVRSESNENDSKFKIFSDEECTTVETERSQGYLCYCDNENNCSAVKEYGYFVNDENDLYKCPINESLCEKLQPIENCNSGSIGKICKYSGEISLCLNYINEETQKDYIVKLTNNAGDYLVNYSDSNIFNLKNNEQYAFVKVDQTSVVLNMPCMYIKFYS